LVCLVGEGRGHILPFLVGKLELQAVHGLDAGVVLRPWVHRHVLEFLPQWAHIHHLQSSLQLFDLLLEVLVFLVKFHLLFAGSEPSGV